MGAFFLYRAGKPCDVSAAEGVFEKKKMGEPLTISVGEWTLLLYKKMQRDTYELYREQDNFLAVIGAAMYKNYPWHEIPKRLYADICEGTFDRGALSGHFNLIYSIGGELHILSDSLQSKHFFCDKDHTFFSSSMLACAAAYPNALHIDRSSVYEKMMLGIIIAPDTPFCEIKSMCRSVKDDFSDGISIDFIESSLNREVDLAKDRLACAEDQIGTLDAYFEQLKAYADGQTTDTGLSAGYDSRLTMSMLLKHFPGQTHFHTHSTKGVHENEKAISMKLAKTAGVTCNAVPTEDLDKQPDLTRLLLDCVYYFDGRSSFVIGGVNPTYTPEYRLLSTGHSAVTLTGVGGEVYRNYYHVHRKKDTLLRYLKNEIIPPAFYDAVRDKTAVRTTMDRIIGKLERHFGQNADRLKGLQYFRRYYSELMMADGQGVVLDAYNQVSDCFAPYINAKVLETAYTDTNVIGIDGQLEAAMICSINYPLAKVTSTYRHSFAKIPGSVILKQHIKSRLSSKTWSRFGSLLPRNRVNNRKNFLQETLENNNFFKEAEKYFQSNFSDVDFEKLFSGKYEFKNLSTLMTVLYLFQEKIDNG